jgi:hypothetical protein
MPQSKTKEQEQESNNRSSHQKLVDYRYNQNRLSWRLVLEFCH